MNDSDLATANGLRAGIDAITAVQAKNALSGARVHIMVTNADKTSILVPESKLQAVLGDSAYNTICGTALSSINTSLTSQKSTKQTAYDDLDA